MLRKPRTNLKIQCVAVANVSVFNYMAHAINYIKNAVCEGSDIMTRMVSCVVSSPKFRQWTAIMARIFKYIGLLLCVGFIVQKLGYSTPWRLKVTAQIMAYII